MMGAVKRFRLLLPAPETARKLGGLLLAVVLLVSPLSSMSVMLQSDLTIDTDALTEAVLSKLSLEDLAELRFVESTMDSIEERLQSKGLGPERVQEAQVLYVVALSEYAHASGFVMRLAGCFASSQTDSQLIRAVNTAFGTDLDAAEFTQFMAPIRSAYISTQGFVAPGTKNNLDLVTWAKNAKNRGWGYVWGTYGRVLSMSYFKSKEAQYPEEVGGYAEFIQSHWVGRRTADCVGLIKGYGWLNPETHEIEYGTNGMPDIGADAMYRAATEKGPISSLQEIPGLAVWKEGHIGIYIGDGQVIHASGTMTGVIQSSLGDTGWTHWLKIPYISYYSRDVSQAPDEQYIWDVLYEEIRNPYGVAGLMGNLYAESGLISNNLQNTCEGPLGYTDAAYTVAVDDGSYLNFETDRAGYGLAQWTVESRKTPLLAFAKERECSIGDLDMQLAFLIQELETKFPGVLEKLKTAASVREASDIVLVRFEAPYDQSDAAKARRAVFGSVYYDRYGVPQPADALPE